MRPVILYVSCNLVCVSYKYIYIVFTMGVSNPILFILLTDWEPRWLLHTAVASDGLQAGRGVATPVRAKRTDAGLQEIETSAQASSKPLPLPQSSLSWEHESGQCLLSMWCWSNICEGIKVVGMGISSCYSLPAGVSMIADATIGVQTQE